uniref:NADPH--hemoprotein reductase n=1 Tax=Ditylenchus dipsaci TaxID=166011 RepID=A0A915D1C9_9BILA
MDFLNGYFDTLDLIVLAAISLAAQLLSSSLSSINSTQKTDRSFLGRMKAEDRQVLILYGSQTGTAEELAGRLAKDLVKYGKKALLLDPEEIEVEDLPKIIEIENPLLILCVATYGEGDPTDNAQNLFEFLTNNDCDLTGLQYAVFGLGNKTYEHYNEVGKFMDKRLEELGAKRAFELGLGDDDANLEEDFMRCEKLSFHRWLKTSFEVISEPSANIFSGEFGRVGAYERQRPHLIRKIHTWPQLLKTATCMVKEVTVVVITLNSVSMVHECVMKPLGGQNCFPVDVELDTVFKLINTDEDSSKRHPFPCPCSFRTALTHYVDICAPVKSHVLKALAEFTEKEDQKNHLNLLSTASDEGLKEYHSFIQKDRRSIVDILAHFDSCKPPLDLLLEMLPRLQARYYSISSSSKIDNTRVSVTALVLRYNIGDRAINGVCTNYLYDKEIGDTCPIFVRKSTVRLPHRLTTPVIMIGPGTGFAPFRGFLQERLWHKKQGKEIGPMVLYFGCRHPEHDFIYKNEMEEYVETGLLTELNLAFSRVQNSKVYVQHKIWENRQDMWELIQKGANIYVCGDARNMARDVQGTFLRVFEEVGGLEKVAATNLMKDLERQRRYQADVWS